MNDYWTAEMAVIVNDAQYDIEFFSGDFDTVREMIEFTQDEYVEMFDGSVHFSVSLNPLNV